MSVSAFKEQKRSSLTWDDVKHLKCVDYETIEDIDNTEKYDWEMIGREKYGRKMYCPKTKILRTQTMGEFYGTSVVD